MRIRMGTHNPNLYLSPIGSKVLRTLGKKKWYYDAYEKGDKLGSTLALTRDSHRQRRPSILTEHTIYSIY